MISLEDCVALSGLTEGQDPPADQPVVQSLEPAACFVPYLLTTQVEVSCLTAQGIEPLKDAIKGIAWSGEIKAEMLEVMINSRHQDALNRGRVATLRVLEALRAGITLELAAMDLRIAVNAIGEIVGQTTTEDLLDMIFSQFCIGK